MKKYYICLLLLSSCSGTINLTTAQKEQKKFGRFKMAPKEALVISGAAFVGYGLGKQQLKKY